jgi:hypothetical protein
MVIRRYLETHRLNKLGLKNHEVAKVDDANSEGMRYIINKSQLLRASITMSHTHEKGSGYARAKQVEDEVGQGTDRGAFRRMRSKSGEFGSVSSLGSMSMGLGISMNPKAAGGTRESRNKERAEKAKHIKKRAW